MNKSKKLAEKISALKSELRSARAAEKEQQAEMAHREIERAIRSSGLLDLVSAGALTSEALSNEFRQAAERAKTAQKE